MALNGKNPSVALRIYEAYVLPKLLYGMEVLSLNQKQLGILSKFQTISATNKNSNSSNLFINIEAMPIEAEIHK
jgi:hypothetical protein